MHSETRNNVSSFKSLFESGENSEGLQQIADFFPALIYIYDTDKKKLRFINKQVTDLLGYSYDDVKSWDHDFMKMVFQEDISLVETELARCFELKDDASHSYDSRFIHKEGKWKYFRIQGTVLRRNDKGNPASLLFVAEDITGHLQTAEEAKASKELLEETEKLLHFGSWSWDLSTDKIICSHGLYKLLGYSPDGPGWQPPSNEDLFKHVTEPDLKALKEAIQVSAKDKIGFERTFNIVTKHGQKKIVLTRANVITTTSGTVKIVGVTNDITEQMLQSMDQQQLKDNLSSYRESMIDKERLLDFGSLEMNFATKELYWSDGMYLLFGYDPAFDKPAISLNDDFYKTHMSDQDFLEAKTKLQEALKKQENYILEIPIRTKQGIPKRLETYGKIEKDRHDRPFKIVGITRDITKLKDYEKNLQQKIEELHRSNKELEEFAYIASHDLQEPLRKITAFSERLQEKAGDEIGPDTRLYLQRILAATQNMRLLIDNLLEFSRTSRHTDPWAKLNLSDVLKEVLTDLELKIEETNARIQQSPLPSIVCYHTQMKQLFTNLLSNAIKFRKPGESPVIDISSVVVSEKEKNERLLPHDRTYYKIIVSDSGIGFEQEYAFKIFQIFQRLHGKAEYPGSGIGLAICKKIVETHNGILYVDSEPGKGAVFSIILPENQ